MSSEMLDETVEEKAMAQQDQSQEKKKVTVKISPKKRVSVKKKIETPEEKVNEEPLPLSSSPVEEEKESPKEEENLTLKKLQLLVQGNLGQRSLLKRKSRKKLCFLLMSRKMLLWNLR